MQRLKQWVRRFIYKENASSESLIRYLREHGAQIGIGVTVYAPNKTLVDKTTPWLLRIGNHVRITEGVKILTHDYSWSVLKRYSSDSVAPGQVLGSQRPVAIGDNVFIGMNAVITAGVTIGDNVIIGAGSVVTKDCPCDGVYAGVPASRIMSVEEFYNKRKQAQFAEAKEIAVRYREAFGVRPDASVFNEYFMLFTSKAEADDVPAFKAHMDTSGNYADTAAYMTLHTPMFSSYEAFLAACYEE